MDVLLDVGVFYGGLSCLPFCDIFGGRGNKGSSSSSTELISRLSLKIAKWALVRKEFTNFNPNDIFF